MFIYLIWFPLSIFRPMTIEVLNHLFCWNAELRISFLRDTSNRINKSSEPYLINVMESVASVVFGRQLNIWSDLALIADLGNDIESTISATEFAISQLFNSNRTFITGINGAITGSWISFNCCLCKNKTDDKLWSIHKTFSEMFYYAQ